MAAPAYQPTPEEEAELQKKKLGIFSFGTNQSIEAPKPVPFTYTQNAGLPPELAGNEFSPELNQQVLNQIRQNIGMQTQQNVAQARGEAAARGLTGGSFEARRTSGAQAAGVRASAEAETQFALEQAQRAREERLRRQDQLFTAGESEKGRAFSAAQITNAQQFETQMKDYQNKIDELARERDRAFQAGQTERAATLNALLQNQQDAAAYARASMEAKAQQQAALYGAGGSILGNYLGGGGEGLAGGGGSALLSLGLAGGGVAAYNALNKTGKALIAPMVNPVGTIKTAAKAVKKVFCFIHGTPIQMYDGTTKPIQFMALGDCLKDGAFVQAVKAAYADEPIYLYKDKVLVTGAHAVKEDGVWIRVGDSKYIKPLFNEGQVYTLVTTTHRIWSCDIEFADEVETDVYEFINPDESLKVLNGLLPENAKAFRS